MTISLLRLVTMLTALSAAAVGIAVLFVGLIHAAEPDKLSITLAQAKVIQHTSSKTGRPGKKSPMTRCLETWDRATQMSKQEWKETCKRTVKEYPDIYNKPF